METILIVLLVPEIYPIAIYSTEFVCGRLSVELRDRMTRRRRGGGSWQAGCCGTKWTR